MHFKSISSDRAERFIAKQLMDTSAFILLMRGIASLLASRENFFALCTI
jgi:hypothetical protein